MPRRPSDITPPKMAAAPPSNYLSRDWCVDILEPFSLVPRDSVDISLPGSAFELLPRVIYLLSKLMY